MTGGYDGDLRRCGKGFCCRAPNCASPPSRRLVYLRENGAQQHSQQASRSTPSQKSCSGCRLYQRKIVDSPFHAPQKSSPHSPPQAPRLSRRVQPTLDPFLLHPGYCVPAHRISTPILHLLSSLNITRPCACSLLLSAPSTVSHQPFSSYASKAMAAPHHVCYHQPRLRRGIRPLQDRAFHMYVALFPCLFFNPHHKCIILMSFLSRPDLDELSLWLRADEDYGHAILFCLIFLTTIRTSHHASCLPSIR